MPAIRFAACSSCASLGTSFVPLWTGSSRAANVGIICAAVNNQPNIAIRARTGRGVWGRGGGRAGVTGAEAARPVRRGGIAAGHAPTEDGAVRPQTLMLNLLGRYLLGRRVVVSAASVIEVSARVGVGEHAARSTLARMVNRGMLTRQRHGRAMYFGLTAQAEQILHDGEDRIWRSGAVNQDWDGYWTLLGFSLPESWQRQRHELRSQLTWAGFGPLFNGLWVAPGRVEVTRLVASLGLESRVKAFYAQAAPGTDIAKMVQ